MKKTIVVLIVIFAAAFCGLSTVGAAPKPGVILSPKKAGPGDLLLITVKNAGGPVEGKFAGRLIYFNPTGKAMKAVVGVDLDSEPGMYPLELSINGTTHTSEVRIIKKKYPLQRLTLPKDKVTLSPEDEARADR